MATDGVQVFFVERNNAALVRLTDEITPLPVRFDALPPVEHGLQFLEKSGHGSIGKIMVEASVEFGEPVLAFELVDLFEFRIFIEDVAAVTSQTRIVPGRLLFEVFGVTKRDQIGKCFGEQLSNRNRRFEVEGHGRKVGRVLDEVLHFCRRSVTQVLSRHRHELVSECHVAGQRNQLMKAS